MATKWNAYRRKPYTAKQIENMAHGQRMLEMAHARELLATWHWKGEKSDRNQWLRDALCRAEKFYGAGGPDRIRKYMRVIEDENSSIPVWNPEKSGGPILGDG